MCYRGVSRTKSELPICVLYLLSCQQINRTGACVSLGKKRVLAGILYEFISYYFVYGILHIIETAMTAVFNDIAYCFDHIHSLL